MTRISVNSTETCLSAGFQIDSEVIIEASVHLAHQNIFIETADLLWSFHQSRAVSFCSDSVLLDFLKSINCSSDCRIHFIIHDKSSLILIHIISENADYSASSSVSVAASTSSTGVAFQLPSVAPSLNAAIIAANTVAAIASVGLLIPETLAYFLVTS